ncbi:poly-gamma-glutamate hydrolase family protein [Shinella zoogloeoides]|uniref:poly-gamma-glutamate hydrolase family protein n=1 Tax=Shinella zoogloeoides TaxID=352475 RepID=UPI001F5A1FE5|nr:poly-gamma-glutamate hydrolase family protein [Shinella zoogloeoides]
MRLKKDSYECFSELEQTEREGIDFRRLAVERMSEIAVVAPHGGEIEPHTSIIARAIAGETHSLYLFEGLRLHRDHCELHITSEKFDEPSAAAIVAAAEVVLGVHGRADNGDGETTWVGGLDFQRRDRIVSALVKAGFSSEIRRPGQSLAGGAQNNICNRGRTRAGVQLEIPRSLRDQLAGNDEKLARFANAVLLGMETGGEGAVDAARPRG